MNTVRMILCGNVEDSRMNPSEKVGQADSHSLAPIPGDVLSDVMCQHQIAQIA